MPTGGDRRPIRRAQDSEVWLGMRLLRAMLQDQSDEGQQFAEQFEELFSKWREVIEAIHQFRGGGIQPGGPAGVGEVREFLDLLCVVSELPLSRHRQAPTQDQTPLTEVGLAGRVRQLTKSVEEFCDRWRLRAPWAASLVIHMWFTRVGFELLRRDEATARWDGSDWAESLGFFVSSPFRVATFPIVAPLPGRTDEEQEVDRQLVALRLHATIEPQANPPLKAHRRPNRQEMTIIERAGDAAVVVIHWDGRPELASQFDRNQRLTPVEYVLEQCALRLGGALTARQKRRIIAAIEPQFRRARAAFLASGYEVIAHGDVDRHAIWLARRVLNPRESFTRLSELAPVQDANGDYQYADPPTVRNACREYARRICLALE